jgi:hypothetical protein
MLKFVRIIMIAATALVIIAAQSQAQNINVVINGQPVAFTGTPPQEINNSVLVPLRGVFEQLGANVQYNPQTKTIFAARGSTNVSLALGSATAYVNGQAEQLAQPPTVLIGTTLVPLRFVAESFGAYVEWQPQTSTVQIQTSPSDSVSNAPPPPSWQNGTPPPSTWQNGAPPPSAWQNTPPSVQHLPRLSAVNGRILNVDNPSAPDYITVGSQNGSVQVTLDYHTRIIENAGPDAAWKPAGLRDLRVGDDISAQVFGNGTARFIQIKFQEHDGRVIGVQNFPNGNRMLLLQNGQTVLVGPNATILHHHQVAERPVQPGDTVSVRLRVGANLGYSIDIN